MLLWPSIMGRDNRPTLSTDVMQPYLYLPSIASHQVGHCPHRGKFNGSEPGILLWPTTSWPLWQEPQNKHLHSNLVSSMYSANRSKEPSCGITASDQPSEVGQNGSGIGGSFRQDVWDSSEEGNRLDDIRRGEQDVRNASTRMNWLSGIHRIG